MNIYCANKNKSENVIIVMYDIFGFDSGRNKIVCDWYEKQGFSVYLPDFFRGDSFDPFDNKNSLETM